MEQASAQGRSAVFISYAREDAPFVDELTISLETHGFDVLVDRQDLFPGEPWEPRLHKLVKRAETTICALSAAWVSSEQCRREFDIAVETGRRVLPIVIEPLPEVGLPQSLTRLQFIFFIGEGRSYARGVADLVTALKSDVKWLLEQTRLLDRSEEWLAADRSPALLLRGPALEAAAAWAAEPAPPDASILPGVLEFVEASQAGAESAERKRLRDRVRFLVVLCVAVVALGASAVAFIGRELGQATERAEDVEVLLEDAQYRLSDYEIEQTTRGAQPSGPVVDWISGEQYQAPQGGRNRQETVSALVEALGAADRADRVEAGERVAALVRSDENERVLRALIDRLAAAPRDRLSENGVFSILYMLNVYGEWDRSPFAGDLAKALEEVEASVDLGPRSADCLRVLRAKLEGAKSAYDVCG